MRAACFSARMGQRSGHRRALWSSPRCTGRTARRLDSRTTSVPLWMSFSSHAADLQVGDTILRVLNGEWAGKGTL